MTEPSTAPAARQQTGRLVVVTVVAVVAGFVGGWIVSDDSDRVNRLEGELAAIQAEATADAAAQAALPNLRSRASRHALGSAIEEGDEEAVSLNFQNLILPENDLREFFDELGFNASAVMERIQNTRALDGTQTAEGDGVTASWTYHPDDGLQLVVERG